METPASRPLTLCHFTAVEVEPPDFIDLAARAGFAAVSLMIQFPRAYQPGFPMAGDTRMRRRSPTSSCVTARPSRRRGVMPGRRRAGGCCPARGTCRYGR